MLNRYSVSLLIFSIAGFVGGCVSTSGKDTLLRSGYADLDTGNLKAADKKARRILKDWDNNHSALLLRAETAAKAGQTKKAVDIITHMDYECKKDMCENETAHINALMLLTTLTQDEDILRKSQEKIEELKKKITVRQHGNLVDFYTRQSRPQDAVGAFEKLSDASGGNLSQDQKLTGFILYYSTFEHEKAKQLYNQLTPQQKVSVQNTFGDIQF